MSNMIHQAAVARAQREIEGKRAAVAGGSWRQRYHFMPPTGWMNDPNGLIFYAGNYHMFYQFNPYQPVWGPMHWGHATSKDLIDWKDLPVALAPSEDYDLNEGGGCFSGSCIEGPDGALTAMFTGTANHGAGFVQTQCIAKSTDGVTFEKHAGNPVIRSYPPEGSSNFRDPKVFRHRDDFYVVIGSSRDNKAKALLYKSKDLLAWEYVGVLLDSDGSWGSMWECPDFFPLGGKYVLLVSPMHYRDKVTLYFVGDMDFPTGRFTWEKMGYVDYGFEYYAPQSLLDDRGRRIIIAWQNAWDWMPWWKDFGPTGREGWCGSMSIPRSLSLDADLNLISKPIEEIKSLRGETRTYGALICGEDGFVLDPPDGVSFEMEMSIDLERTTARVFGFMARASEEHRTLVLFDVVKSEMSFDRNNADDWSVGVRVCPFTARDKTLSVRFLSDTISMEIFLNDGDTTMSNNIFPSPGEVGLRLFARNGCVAIKELTIHSLRSIRQ